MKSYSTLIIKNSEGKFLLQQKDRTYPKYPYYWNNIGGAIEEGETPKEAIIREVKEELGIEIEMPQNVGVLISNGKEENIFYKELNLDISKIIIGEGRAIDYKSKEEFNELKILPNDRKMLEYFIEREDNFKKI
jgi:8-oxo-dGTP diphosphatase